MSKRMLYIAMAVAGSRTFSCCVPIDGPVRVADLRKEMDKIVAQRGDAGPALDKFIRSRLSRFTKPL